MKKIVILLSVMVSYIFGGVQYTVTEGGVTRTFTVTGNEIHVYKEANRIIAIRRRNAVTHYNNKLNNINRGYKSCVRRSTFAIDSRNKYAINAVINSCKTKYERKGSRLRIKEYRLEDIANEVRRAWGMI